MNEKILVIGSNSFSGASFTDYVLDQGYAVIGVSRSTQPDSVFLPYINKDYFSERFSFYQFDINKNFDEVITLVEQEEPSYIVNFAAQGMVAESWLYPEHWFMTNAVSTTMLFNRLKDFNFIRKYVHITTPEVYGSCSGYVREDQRYNPSTPYAASRAAGDMSLKTFIDNYGFPAVSTRAANVFGAGQQLYRIIPRTIFYIRQARKLQLHGGGLSKRSFVHITDVADATLKVMLDAPVGEIYHIATGSTITIKELVQLICRKMQAEYNEVVEVADERMGKDSAYFLDSSKIRNAFGWHEKISLQEGIEEVINWVDQNMERLQHQNESYVHKE